MTNWNTPEARKLRKRINSEVNARLRRGRRSDSAKSYERGYALHWSQAYGRPIAEFPGLSVDMTPQAE